MINLRYDMLLSSFFLRKWEKEKRKEKKAHHRDEGNVESKVPIFDEAAITSSPPTFPS